MTEQNPPENLVTTYLVNRDGQQFGPYTLKVLRRYVQEGHIDLEDYLWCEGMPDWTTVGDLLGSTPPDMPAPATHASTSSDAADTPHASTASNDTASATFEQTQPPMFAEPARSAPAASAVPASRKPVGKWIGIGAAVVIVGAIALFAVQLLSGPQPEDAIDQARLAFLNRDQAEFAKYVDVQGVLDNWVDQSVNALLAKNDTGPLAAVAVQAALPTVKHAFLPTAAQAVGQFIVSGAPTSEQSTGDANPVGAFLMSYLSSATRQLATSQLTYMGVESKQVTGDDAALAVKVGSAFRSEPIHLKVRMHRFGDFWRVVAVDDVLGLLQQMSGSGSGQSESGSGAPGSGTTKTSSGDSPGSAPSVEPNAPPPPADSTGVSGADTAGELPYPGDAPSTQGAPAEPPAAPPPSAENPAGPPKPSTTDGGFGDLIGEGGFIKPPPEQKENQ